MTPKAPGRSDQDAAMAAGAGSIFDPATMNLRLFSSFPKAQQYRAFELMESTDGAVKDLVGQKITLQHIVSHRVDMVDKETGEVKDADRIVLVTTDGKSYACVSDGIRRGLQRIMAVTNSMPPWDKGLAVEIKEFTTRNGFTSYSIVPVE